MASVRRWGIQFMSGLHADQGWSRAWSAMEVKAPKAPNLALLGNCGSVASPYQIEQTREFLLRCSATWKKIFWVPGPLELSSSRKGIVADQRYELLKLVSFVTARGGGGAVILLDQREYTFYKDNVVILGATGWPDLPGYTGTIPSTSFEGIKLWTTDGGAGGQPRNLRTADIHAWNAEDLNWIRERHDWWSTYDPDLQIIILTHHLCSTHLLSSGSGSTPNEYKNLALGVMSDESTADILDPRTGLIQPAAWLCGATASSCTGLLGRGTFIGVNSRYDVGGMATAAPWMSQRRFELPSGKVRME